MDGLEVKRKIQTRTMENNTRTGTFTHRPLRNPTTGRSAPQGEKLPCALRRHQPVRVLTVTNLHAQRSGATDSGERRRGCSSVN